MNICILTHGKGRFVKGTTYSTKHLYEAGVSRGHNIRVINAELCYVHIDADDPRVMYEGESLGGFDAVIPRIMPDLTSYGSAILRQFEMMGVYTPNRSIAIVRSHDKFRSLQLLSKAGVGIPKTIFCRETTEVDDMIEQIGLPMIIKIPHGTQGKGVVLAETRKAARSVSQALHILNTSTLLQDFIEEASGTDIRALVVGNQVVASMQRQSLDDEFRSNIHQGGEGTPIKLTDDEKHLALKAAKATGLSICGVDIIRSARGPLVLEVNSSPGLEGIEAATGRDVAGKIIEYVERNATQTHRKDRVGA